MWFHSNLDSNFIQNMLYFIRLSDHIIKPKFWNWKLTTGNDYPLKAGILMCLQTLELWQVRCSFKHVFKFHLV